MSLDTAITKKPPEQHKNDLPTREELLARGAFELEPDVYFLPGNRIIRLNGHKTGKCEHYRECGNSSLSNAICCLDMGYDNGVDITARCYVPWKSLNERKRNTNT